MIRYITAFIVVGAIFWFLGLMVTSPTGTSNEPDMFIEEVLAAYTDTTEPAHGLVDVVPHFAGLETGTSSESIHFVNEYGDCGWEVNECWLTTFIGVVPAGPHNLLDGVVHPDTVAQAATRGSIVVADATPDWNELVIGAIGTILTSDGNDAAWALPAAPAAHRLDQVLSPNANTQWNMTFRQLRLLYTNPAVADGGLEIEASGAFAGDLVHIHQHTGNPGAVDLLHLEADDVDVRPLLVEAANNTVNSIETIGPILMTDGNEAAGFIIMDDGTGTGIMQWTDPATIPGTWLQVAELPVIVQGAEVTVRALGAYATLIEDVVVSVSCRSVNGGIVWSALSHPTPVADTVTFFWLDTGDGNITVHIMNDGSLDILCTISYSDL